MSILSNKVTIQENPTTNEVITLKEIPDGLTGEMKTVGILRVMQTKKFMKNNFMQRSNRSCFITLSEEDMEDYEGLLFHNQLFPMDGKIVVTETLEPYVKKDGSKQEPKRKGKDGDIITSNGRPIYMNSHFSSDMSEQDVLIKASAVADTEGSFDSGEDSPE